MPVYHVYEHPVKGYTAVKEGFSWPGFFFSWIWALTKQMWVLAVGVMVTLISLFEYRRSEGLPP